MWRLLKAILVGAVSGPILALLLVFGPMLMFGIPADAEGFRMSGRDVVLFFQVLFFGYILALPFVFFFVMVVGVPVDRLFQRQGWRAAYSYILAGALSGMMLGVLACLLSVNGRWWDGLSKVAACTIGGLLAAWVWWRGGPQSGAAMPLDLPGK